MTAFFWLPMDLSFCSSCTFDSAVAAEGGASAGGVAQKCPAVVENGDSELYWTMQVCGRYAMIRRPQHKAQGLLLDAGISV